MNTSLFHVNSDKNQFGFYKVGDHHTYSKYDAIAMAEASGKEIQWIFNDHVYSRYDWSMEPAESLEDLYRRRAQQLREKYDYIVLSLSGGADSHNALMAFLKNGIHLDEVMTYHCLDGDKGDQSTFQNAEPFRVAIPYAEMLTKQHPNIKQRVVDMTDLIMKFWKDHPEAKFDYLYYGNTMNSIHNVARADLKYFVDDYRKIIESGKKLCILTGVDKPGMVYENGQWSAYFYDIVDHSVPPNLQMYNRENDYNEFFYWSPELPEIVIKQCHIIKKYFSVPNNIDSIGKIHKFNRWGHEFSTSHVTINGKKVFNEQIKPLIYPYWSSDTYSNEKSPTGLMFTLRDNWFYGSGTDESKTFINNASKIVSLDRKWFGWVDINNEYRLKEHAKIFKSLIYPNHRQFAPLIGGAGAVKKFPHTYKMLKTKYYPLTKPHANHLT